MKSNSVLSFVLLFGIFIFTGCVKNDASDNNLTALCNSLSSLHATPVAAVTKGDDINLSADYLDAVYYTWTGPNNYTDNGRNNTITSANFYNEGWYHVSFLVDGCETKSDSVYVDVKFPQGTAACTPADNTAAFSGPLLLGDQSFYFVQFGPTTGGYGVVCNSSNGDMSFTFSSYWETHELEDGVYYTTSTPLPDFADIDKIYISDVNQSIFWVAEPDKPVYISHVGGKARITFCNVIFSGDWGGTLYQTTVDAQVTKP